MFTIHKNCLNITKLSLSNGRWSPGSIEERKFFSFLFLILNDMPTQLIGYSALETTFTDIAHLLALSYMY